MRLHLFPFFAFLVGVSNVACGERAEQQDKEDLVNKLAKIAKPSSSNDKDSPSKSGKSEAVDAGVQSTGKTKSVASEVLASFKSEFKFEGTESIHRRARNIEVAASKLNGQIILPGEELSFNATVGERTKEAGFGNAVILFAGEVVEGMGGGVCQVSSTLHAAARFGALTITERTSHSRPSSYIDRGLDATVNFGKLDLKIKIPYDVPIKIVAKITEPGTLEIKILGLEKRYEVKHRHLKMRQPIKFSRRIRRGKYHRGPPKRKQRGRDGIPGVSYWEYIDKETGEKKTIRTESRYKAVPEIWEANNIDSPPDGGTK